MALSRYERFAYGLSGRLPEMQEREREEKRRNELAKLGRDLQGTGPVPTQPGVMGPMQPKAPIDTKTALARIAEITGDPTQYLNYQIQQNDPSRQLDIDYKRAQLANLQRVKPTQTSVGGSLYFDDDPYDDQPGEFITPPKKKADSENERQINALMARGIPRSEAENIAYGFSSITTNPVTGESSIIDKVTGEAKPVQFSQEPTAPKSLAEIGNNDISLWDESEKATGAISTGKELLSGTLGQIPGVPVAEETIESRQTLRNAQNDIVRALSINSRYPVAEINRLREEINIAPKFFDDPDAMKSRMRSVDRYLKNVLQKEKQVSENRNMPTDRRQDALQKVSAIENFLDILDVPPEGQKDGLLPPDKQKRLEELRAKKAAGTLR